VLSGFPAAPDEGFPDLAGDIRNECPGHPPLRRAYAAFAPAGQISERERDRLTGAASDPAVWAAQAGRFVRADCCGLTDTRQGGEKVPAAGAGWPESGKPVHRRAAPRASRQGPSPLARRHAAPCPAAGQGPRPSRTCRS